MSKDIRSLENNHKYVYGYFPLGGSSVSTSPHVNVVHDIRAAGVETFVKDEILYFATKVNSCDLPIENADMITLLSSGLYINDLPVGCQMTKDKLSDLVPAGIPASINYSMEEETLGEESQMTWQEWFDMQGNYNRYTESIDGNNIAFKLVSRGIFFDSPIWLILMQAGISFMSWDDYSTLLASENYLITDSDLEI